MRAGIFAVLGMLGVFAAIAWAGVSRELGEGVPSPRDGRDGGDVAIADAVSFLKAVNGEEGDAANLKFRD